jgi:hypothetical protein
MISIVVQAYDEEDGIVELYRRIAPLTSDSRLKVISFSRNFSHQAAVSADS